MRLCKLKKKWDYSNENRRSWKVCAGSRESIFKINIVIKYEIIFNPDCRHTHRLDSLKPSFRCVRSTGMTFLYWNRVQPLSCEWKCVKCATVLYTFNKMLIKLNESVVYLHIYHFEVVMFHVKKLKHKQ